MITSATRRRRPADDQPIVIEQWTQHWRIVQGESYRDAVVRMPSGRRRMLAISADLQTVVAVAA